MNRISKQKAQLLLNAALMVLAFFALIVSVVAWFSNSNYAEIQALNVSVQQKEFELLEKPEAILFPCATKLDDVSEDDFNKKCIVVAKYVIKDDLSVVVEVDNDDGVLGYVWDEEIDGEIDDNPDYYSVISKAIADKSVQKPYNYDSLVNALNSINRRSVGQLNSDGNTEVYIVYWADYNALGMDLNSISNGVYEYKQIDFSVDLTFIV